MEYQSPIQIDYVIDGDAHTLVAVGDWIDGLRFDMRQDLHESDGYNAANAWFHPLGGALAGIAFTVERVFDEYEAAQEAFLAPEMLGEVDLVVATGILRFTCDDEVWEYANAVMQSPRPTLPIRTNAVAATAYQFTTPATPAEA
jgi:hypothetical protein